MLGSDNLSSSQSLSPILKRICCISNIYRMQMDEEARQARARCCYEAIPSMEESKLSNRLTTDWKARSYRRYDLEFPVLLRFQDGGVFAQCEGVSKNLSVGGLLVRSVVPLPLHTPAQFTLIMHGRNAVRPVHIVGEGEVVRVTASVTDGAFLIAVQCKTPVTQLEKHLS